MAFDPYQQWLGIAAGPQPPDAYALLGLDRFESDAQTIRDATQERIATVRARAEWDQLTESRRVISELLSAQSTLLDDDRRREYDESLRGSAQPKSKDELSDNVATLSVDDILPFESIKIDNIAGANATLSLESAPSAPEPKPSTQAPLPTLSLEAATPPELPAHSMDDAASAMSKTSPSSPTLSLDASARDLPKSDGGLEPDSPSVKKETKPTPGDDAEESDRHVWSVAAYAAVALCICVVITLVAGQFRDPGATNVASNDESNASSNPVNSIDAKSASAPKLDNSTSDVNIAAESKKSATETAVVADDKELAKDDSDSKKVAISEPSKPNPSTPSKSNDQVVAQTDKTKVKEPDATNVKKKAEPKPDSQPNKTDQLKPIKTQVADVDNQPPQLALINLTTLPRDLPEFKTIGDRDEYVSRLNQMMYDGFGSGRTGLVKAEKSFEAARQLTKKDPRLYYGYGLVLWKRLRFDEAQRHFESAMEVDGQPYWPAWAALARFHLARRKHELAFEKLSAMAAAMEDNQADAVQQKAADEASKWLGRLVGYLEEPTNAVYYNASNIASLDDEIVAALGPELRQRFMEGKQSFRDDFDAIAKSTKKELAKIDQEQKEHAKEKQAKVAKDKKDQEDAADQLNLSAEKLKQQVEEQMQDFEDQLKEMAANYQELETEASGLGISINRISTEIDNLFATINRNGNRSSVDVQNQRLLGVKQNQRDQLQVRYRMLEKNANALRNQARAIMQKRQKTVDDYKKATGKLIAQSDQLRKWSKVLERRGKTKNRKSAARSRTLKRQATVIKTYLPFDVKEEKDFLMKSIPKADSKPDASQ